MEKVPVHPILPMLKVLHAKFEAESGTACSYQTFYWNIPYYVIKPRSTDWGTCLCHTYLNPELKLFTLKKIQGDAVFGISNQARSATNGKMTKVTTNAACVHCLKKPLVVIIPQDIERDDDLAYRTVYQTSLSPRLVKVNRGWKWIY